MYFCEELITPQRAKELLSKNKNNRPVNKRRVNALMNDISSGNWKVTPQGISVDKGGNLIDGQHRLEAVLRSNTAVPMIVAYDVESDAVIDRGQMRSMKDSLYMRGLIDKKLADNSIVSIVNTYLRMSGLRNQTDSEKSAFMNAHSNNLILARILTKCKRGCKSNRAGIMTAVFAALEAGVSAEVLDRFIYVVNTGFASSESEFSAIVLKNYLDNTKLDGELKTIESCMVAQMAICDFSDKIPRKRAYAKPRNVYIKRLERAV